MNHLLLSCDVPRDLWAMILCLSGFNRSCLEEWLIC